MCCRPFCDPARTSANHFATCYELLAAAFDLRISGLRLWDSVCSDRQIGRHLPPRTADVC
jgi:hypothetical protein